MPEGSEQGDDPLHRMRDLRGGSGPPLQLLREMHCGSAKIRLLRVHPLPLPGLHLPAGQPRSATLARLIIIYILCYNQTSSISPPPSSHEHPEHVQLHPRLAARLQLYPFPHADKLPNSIINCPHFLHGGILFPLANSLQFYDGKKTRTIHQCKREIAALDMRGHWIGIGERASPGQLISAVLLDTREPEAARVFNYQKTQISHIAIGSNGEFFCTVGSSSEQTYPLPYHREDLIVI